jgi:thiol-disulfide isomerase/thioredoxin
MFLRLTFLSLLMVFPAKWDFHLRDSRGNAHTSTDWQQHRATVLLFVSTECPISNRYAPTIIRMVQEFAAQSIGFYLVQSDSDLSPAAAEEHATEFKLTIPILMDPTQILAAKLGVKVTPTAVIVNPAGEIQYRGRVDDRNIDLGKYRDAPKREDLKIALKEILSGKPVSQPETKVIGCFLPPPRK